MSPDLKERLESRLLSAFNFKKKSDGWLRSGECPECRKKELYSNYWAVTCGRLNKCGYKAHVKELFADLFSDWTKRAEENQKHLPKEKQNPNEAADLYLQEGRGFDLDKIKGWYKQEYFYKADTRQGSATVRFAVGNGYWERIIDKPERFGSDKAQFTYKTNYKGLWWKPPTLCIDNTEELWIVEGIFDAIALLHHGIAAVSIMSAYNYPEEALKQLKIILNDAQKEQGSITLVWALDRGKAGEQSIQKFYTRAIDDGWKCEAALPPVGKRDWNDLHQLDCLGQDDIKQYKYFGALLVAKTAKEKALLMYKNSYIGSSFDFDFNHMLWWADVDAKKLEAVKKEMRDEGCTEDEIKSGAVDRALKVECILNATL